jgi:hypothetical protein
MLCWLSEGKVKRRAVGKPKSFICKFSKRSGVWKCQKLPRSWLFSQGSLGWHLWRTTYSMRLIRMLYLIYSHQTWCYHHSVKQKLVPLGYTFVVMCLRNYLSEFLEIMSSYDFGPLPAVLPKDDGWKTFALCMKLWLNYRFV